MYILNTYIIFDRVYSYLKLGYNYLMTHFLNQKTINQRNVTKKSILKIKLILEVHDTKIRQLKI